MPVKVKCSSCEKILTAPDQARGKAIKCPNCQSVVAVPRESKSAEDKKRVAGEAKPEGKARAKKAAEIAAGPDSEELLTKLNLSQAADDDANICPKCGADIWDEEIEDCPKCGINLATGDLGEKAKRKLMKGPDPAKFYENIWGDAWTFTMKNHVVVWRTFAYLTIGYLWVALSVYSLILFFHLLPLKIFWGLLSTIGFALVPGWFWSLAVETEKLTLERKDKFRRLPFDFFQSCAMGVTFAGWGVIYALPAVAGIGVLLYLFLNQEVVNIKPWMVSLAISTGMIPFLWLFPPFIARMATTTPKSAWLPWVMYPIWFRHAKASFVWLMISLPFALPMIGSVCLIGGVWGEKVDNWRRNTMMNQRVVFAQKFMEESSGKAENKVKPKPEEIAHKEKMKEDALREIVAVDNNVLIVPAILIWVSLVPLSYGYSVSSRILGQFTYFFSKTMSLEFMERQRKYVAKAKKSEDDDEDPSDKALTLSEAGAIVGIMYLLGAVGGYFHSTAGGITLGTAISFWLLIAAFIGAVIGQIVLLKAAKKHGGMWISLCLLVPFGGVAYIVKHPEEGKKHSLAYLFGLGGLVITSITVSILFAVGVVQFSELWPASSPAAAPDQPAAVGPANPAPANPAPANPAPANPAPAAPATK